MPNLRRGANRIFIILAAAWALYCLFIYPIQMARMGTTHYEADRKFCFEEPRTNDAELQRCLAQAEEVPKRLIDQEFMLSIGRFIDDLAESNDLTLTNLLVVSVIEGIASDPAAAAVVKEHIGPMAHEIMKEVETKIYGRSG